MIGIYARQSVDKKDSISIETQIDMCKKQTLEENPEFKIYNDKGFSGKNTERPAFKQLMLDVKNGLITQIIVYKLDRVSRNLLDFTKILDVLEKQKVSFISCSEKIDTSSPSGRAMVYIIMVFAQMERENIQSRIKDNYYARGEKGMYMGGRAPYGFKKIPTTINGKKTYTYTEVADQVQVLEEMYNMYAYQNVSLGYISRHLNDKGVKSAEGKNWDNNKISRALHSPIYVESNADIYTYYKSKGVNVVSPVDDFKGNGLYLYGKRESNERKYTDVTNHYLSVALHEGIIEPDTWLKCQYRLETNKQIKNTGKGTHTWLSGLLKCKNCGYSVCVVNSRGVKYLSCKGKTLVNACEGLGKTIFSEQVENIVEKQIIDKIDALKNTKVEQHNNRNLNKIKIEIAKLDEQIENLVIALAEGDPTVIKYITPKLNSLEIEKNKYIKELQEETLNDATLSISNIIDKVKDFAKLEFEDKKEVAYTLINKVLLNKDTIEIEWKI